MPRGLPRGASPAGKLKPNFTCQTEVPYKHKKGDLPTHDPAHGNPRSDFCLLIPERIMPDGYRIQPVPGQYEFHLKGGRFACIGETEVCNDIPGRGSLQGSRFQNRIDNLFFGLLVSFSGLQ
jgi:hypothetical protein